MFRFLRSSLRATRRLPWPQRLLRILWFWLDELGSRRETDETIPVITTPIDKTYFGDPDA
jgi:hypothetical protein